MTARSRINRWRATRAVDRRSALLSCRIDDASPALRDELRKIAARG